MEKMEKQIVMEKEFVPNPLALKMKALGFDEPCIACYTQNAYGSNKDQKIQYWHSPIDGNNDYVFVLAPTWQSAFRWFREKYNWQHSIDPTSDQHSFELGYNYWIWNYKTGEEYHTMPKNRPTGDWEFETYEEAELACLTKLIEIVENEKML